MFHKYNLFRGYTRGYKWKKYDGLFSTRIDDMVTYVWIYISKPIHVKNKTKFELVH